MKSVYHTYSKKFEQNIFNVISSYLDSITPEHRYHLVFNTTQRRLLGQIYLEKYDIQNTLLCRRYFRSHFWNRINHVDTQFSIKVITSHVHCLKVRGIFSHLRIPTDLLEQHLKLCEDLNELDYTLSFHQYNAMRVRRTQRLSELLMCIFGLWNNF